MVEADVWPEWSHEPKITRTPSGEFVLLFAMYRNATQGGNMVVHMSAPPPVKIMIIKMYFIKKSCVC